VRETTVAFDNVQVVGVNDLTLRCRVGGRKVTVGRLECMPGTTVHVAGDVGRLIIPRWAVRELGLTESGNG
jgi:hypothetical protein